MARSTRADGLSTGVRSTQSTRGTHAWFSNSKPTLQVMAHAVPSQLAVPLVGAAAHGVHEVVPQLVSALFALHVPLHLWNPALQVIPQVPRVQVAVPLESVAQGVHEVVPQLLTALLATHAPLHLWNPVLHVIPHTPVVHVAIPLASVGQAVQDDVPQELTDVFAAHVDWHM
jgi:hypothetical protein